MEMDSETLDLGKRIMMTSVDRCEEWQKKKKKGKEEEEQKEKTDKPEYQSWRYGGHPIHIR